MQQTSPKKKRAKARRLLRNALCDALITGLILVVYALFQHVIPIYRARQENARLLAATPVTPAPLVAAEPTPSPTPEPDRRTEWQKRFAEHFTEDVVVTENSYTSPNVSVTITTHSEVVDHRQVRWYVADIYVASLDNIATALANDAYNYYAEQDILDMMAGKNAVVAMSGDSCLRQAHCFAVKNGVVCDDRPNAANICLLYADGTMEIVKKDDMDVEALLSQTGDKAVVQSWHFGPTLLNPDGSARTEIRDALDQYVFMGTRQPRAGIGYYEPGHYCLIVAEGRIAESFGVTMVTFATLFEREGCALAYNLDGGRSAQLAFDGRKYSVQSNGNANPQNDIIYVVDVAPKGGAGQ